MLMRTMFMIGAARSLRSFRRGREGSAAIEFALVAPMFFALLFAIIETGLVFFAGQVLETGTQDAARLIFTNQVQSQSMSQADFKAKICARVTSLFDCNSIQIDVQSFAPGTTISITNPINSSGAFVSNFVYNVPPAGSSNTVVVRAFYQWPLYVTQLGYNISNINRGTANSKLLLAATAAFIPQ